MDFAEYSGMEIVRALLPTVDDFERALRAAPASGPGDEFLKGIELIYKRLLEALTKQGLEPIILKDKVSTRTSRGRSTCGARRSGGRNDPRRIPAWLQIQRQVTASFDGESSCAAVR